MVMVHSATVKVIKDGRITIPSDIRELEDINEGDYVKITIEKIDRPKKEKEISPSKNVTHDTIPRQNQEAKTL